MGTLYRSYSYHADASALGGSLVQPFHKIVPSQAEVSLPSAGGFTAARTGPFVFDEIVSCSAGHCRASGSISLKSGGWSTLVTAVVEDLNLLEIVTAERVVAQLSVEHPQEGDTPLVTFVGSQFVGLRIAGFPVEPLINLDLLTPSEDYPHQPWLKNERVLKAAREQHFRRLDGTDAPEWVEARHGWVGSDQTIGERGHVAASLVDGFKGTIVGRSYGHIIEIPEFGKFFFGEVSFYHHMFRLTMVRADLGCPVKGHVSGGTAGSNGQPVP